MASRFGVAIIAVFSSLARAFFPDFLGFSIVFVDFVLEAREYGIVFVLGGQAFRDLSLAFCYRRHSGDYVSG
jgi:hypothetical protein